MNKKDAQLKRRLELVRTTVRELTPSQLAQVEGGNSEFSTQQSCHFTPKIK